MAELPAEAYNEVVNAFKANPAGTNGIKPESIETSAGIAYYTAENAKDGATNVRRYSMILPGGAFSGYIAVQVPENAEQDLHRRGGAADVCLGGGPQGGSGRGAAWADAVQDQRTRRFQECPHAGGRLLPSFSPTAMKTAGFEAAPFMVIGLMGSAPAQPEDRGRFAQEAATTHSRACARRGSRCPSRSASTACPAMKRASMRISGKDNTPVTVVQWLRFGGPTTLRIIGSAPRDQWAKAFPRFRAVRDGIQPR